MARFSPYCQQLFTVKRNAPEHRVAQRLAILAVLLGNCLGCWQEIRYEPEPMSKATQQNAAPAADPSAAVLAQPPMPERSEQASVEVERDEMDLEKTEDEAKASGPFETTPATSAMALTTWQMSSKWSMAAALQAKDRSETVYGERLEQAQTDAQVLGVKLPELPVHAEGIDRVSANLTYLLETAGPQLAQELNELHGADHAALAELATKTHALLLSYTPRSARLEPVIESIRQAAEKSGLSEQVWRELIDLLLARAEFAEVKAAIFKLHIEANYFLELAKLNLP